MCIRDRHMDYEPKDPGQNRKDQTGENKPPNLEDAMTHHLSALAGAERQAAPRRVGAAGRNPAAGEAGPCLPWWPLRSHRWAPWLGYGRTTCGSSNWATRAFS